MARLSHVVRHQVRNRAKDVCEYCTIPDTVTHFSHQVDHIIPHRHGGSDDFENLAWSCFHCNNNKGTDIATFDIITKAPVLLFNPCTDAWTDHFALENGFIHAQTPTGRATSRLLKMDYYKRVLVRQLII